MQKRNQQEHKQKEYEAKNKELSRICSAARKKTKNNNYTARKKPN